MLSFDSTAEPGIPIIMDEHELSNLVQGQNEELKELLSKLVQRQQLMEKQLDFYKRACKELVENSKGISAFTEEMMNERERNREEKINEARETVNPNSITLISIDSVLLGNELTLLDSELFAAIGNPFSSPGRSILYGSK